MSSTARPSSAASRPVSASGVNGIVSGGIPSGILTASRPSTLNRDRDWDPQSIRHGPEALSLSLSPPSKKRKRDTNAPPTDHLLKAPIVLKVPCPAVPGKLKTDL